MRSASSRTSVAQEEGGKNEDVMGEVGVGQTVLGLISHGEECGPLQGDGSHGWA